MERKGEVILLALPPGQAKPFDGERYVHQEHTHTGVYFSCLQLFQPWVGMEGLPKSCYRNPAAMSLMT